MKPLQIWILSFILFAGISSSAAALDANGATTPPQPNKICPNAELVAKIKAAAIETIAMYGKDKDEWGRKVNKQAFLGKLLNALIARGDMDGARDIYQRVSEVNPVIPVLDKDGNLRDAKNVRDNDIIADYHFTRALEGKEAALKILGKMSKRVRLRQLTAEAKAKADKLDFTGAWELVELIEQDMAQPYDDKDFPSEVTCNYTPPKYEPYESALTSIAEDFIWRKGLDEALKISDKITGVRQYWILSLIMRKQRELKDEKSAEVTYRRALDLVEKIYENDPKNSMEYLDTKIELLIDAGNYSAASDAIQKIGDTYVQGIRLQEGRYCRHNGAIGRMPVNAQQRDPDDKYTPNYYKKKKYQLLVINVLRPGGYEEADKYARLSGDPTNLHKIAEYATDKGDFEIAKRYNDELNSSGDIWGKIIGLINLQSNIEKQAGTPPLFVTTATLSSPNPSFEKLIAKGMYKEAQEFANKADKVTNDKIINIQILRDLTSKDAQNARAILTAYLGIDDGKYLDDGKYIENGKNGLVRHRELVKLFVEKGFTDEAKQVLVEAQKRQEKMQNWERADALEDILLMQQTIDDEDGTKVTQQKIEQARKDSESHQEYNTSVNNPQPINSRDTDWSMLPTIESRLIREIDFGAYIKADKTEKEIAREVQRKITIERYKKSGSPIPNMPQLILLENDPAYKMDEGNTYAHKFAEFARKIIIMQRRLSRDDQAGAIKMAPTLLSYGMGNKFVFGSLMSAEMKAGMFKEAMEISNQVHNDYERAQWLIDWLQCNNNGF